MTVIEINPVFDQIRSEKLGERQTDPANPLPPVTTLGKKDPVQQLIDSFKQAQEADPTPRPLGRIIEDNRINDGQPTVLPDRFPSGRQMDDAQLIDSALKQVDAGVKFKPFASRSDAETALQESTSIEDFFSVPRFIRGAPRTREQMRQERLRDRPLHPNDVTDQQISRFLEKFPNMRGRDRATLARLVAEQQNFPSGIVRSSAFGPPISPFAEAAGVVSGIEKGLISEPLNAAFNGLSFMAELAGNNTLAEFYEEAAVASRQIQAEGTIAKLARDAQQFEQAGQFVAQLVPSMASLLVSGGSSGPVLLYFGVWAFGGRVEEAREIAREKGINTVKFDTFMQASGSALIEIVSEKMGLDIIGKVTTRQAAKLGEAFLGGKFRQAATVITGITAGSAVEGVEEVVALTFDDMLVAKGIPGVVAPLDPERRIGTGAGTAFAGGAGGGTLLGIAGMMSRPSRRALRVRRRRAERVLKDLLEKEQREGGQGDTSRKLVEMVERLADEGDEFGEFDLPGVEVTERTPVTYVGFQAGTANVPGAQKVNLPNGSTVTFDPDVHRITGLDPAAAEGTQIPPELQQVQDIGVSNEERAEARTYVQQVLDAGTDPETNQPITPEIREKLSAILEGIEGQVAADEAVQPSIKTEVAEALPEQVEQSVAEQATQEAVRTFKQPDPATAAVDANDTSTTAALARAQAALRERGHANAAVEQTAEEELQAWQREVRDVITTHTGRQIVFVKFDELGEGTRIVGAADNHGRQILIDSRVQEEDAVKSLIAHEITHTLQATEEWQKLLQVLRATDPEGLQQAGLSYYRAFYPNGTDFNVWQNSRSGTNESLATYVENNALNSGFYERLANRQPGVLRTVRDTLNKLKAALGSKRGRLAVAMADLADAATRAPTRVEAREVETSEVMFKAETPNGRTARRRLIQELNRLVPQAERFTETSGVRPGRKARMVDGRAFTEADETRSIPEDALPTQEDLGRLLQEAINDTGREQVENALRAHAAENKNRKPTPELRAITLGKVKIGTKTRGGLSDAAALSPQFRFWYEQFVDVMERRFRGFSNQAMDVFMQVFAATSARTKVRDNALRAISVMSEYMSGAPIVTDVTSAGTLREALFDNLSSDARLKTGNFALTFQFLSGRARQAPLTTNDAIISQGMGLSTDALSREPVLYEMQSRYFIKVANAINEKLPPDAEPVQPWHLQAGLWSAWSENDQNFVDAIDEAFQLIEEAEIPVSRTREGFAYLTPEQLANTAIADAIRPNLDVFRNAVIATVEVNSHLDEGAKRADETRRRLLATGNPGLVNKVYNGSKSYEGIGLSAMRAIGFTSTFTRPSGSTRQSNSVSELLVAITGLRFAGARPLDTPETIKISRIGIPKVEGIDVPGPVGSWQSNANANMRLPLRNDRVKPEHRRVLLAVLGKAFKQEAMGASRFRPLAEGEQASGVEVPVMFIRGGKASKEIAQRISAESQRFGTYNIAMDEVANGAVVYFFPEDNSWTGLDPDSAGAVIQQVTGADDISHIRADFESEEGFDFITSEQYDQVIEEFEKGLEDDESSEDSEWFQSLTANEQTAVKQIAPGKNDRRRFLRDPGILEQAEVPNDIRKRGGKALDKSRLAHFIRAKEPIFTAAGDAFRSWADWSDGAQTALARFNKKHGTEFAVDRADPTDEGDEVYFGVRKGVRPRAALRSVSPADLPREVALHSIAVATSLKGSPNRATAERVAAGHVSNQAPHLAGQESRLAKNALAIVRQSLNPDGSINEDLFERAAGTISAQAERRALRAEGTVKSRIRRTVGMEKLDERLIRESQALKAGLKAQARAGRQAAREARRATLDQAKERISQIRQAAQNRTRAVQSLTKELVAATQDLPAPVQRRMLVDVRDVRTFPALMKALAKADKIASEHERRQAIQDLIKTMKGIRLDRLRPEFREAVEDTLGKAQFRNLATTGTARQIEAVAEFLGADETAAEFLAEGSVQDLKRVAKQIQREGRRELADLTTEEAIDMDNALRYFRHLNLTTGQALAGNKLVQRARLVDAVAQEIGATTRKRKVDPVTGRPIKTGTNLFQLLIAAPLKPDTMAELISGSEDSTTHAVLYDWLDAAVTEMLGGHLAAEDALIKALADVDIEPGSAALAEFSEAMDTEITWVQAMITRQPRRAGARTKQITHRLESGQNLILNKAQRMYLLASLRDRDTFFQIVNRSVPINIGGRADFVLTATDVRNIEEKSRREDPRELQLVDAMMEHINGPIKQAVREWSIQNLGYDITKRSTFFTRKRLREPDVREIGAANFVRRTMESMGFLKERVEFAKQPIIIGDIFAEYHNLSWRSHGLRHLGPAVKTARQVLTDRKVREEFDAAKGNQNRYWQRLMDEMGAWVMGGRTPKGPIAGWTSKMVDRVTRGLLATNPRVIMYQPVSILTASTEIEGAYLRSAFARVWSPGSAKDIRARLDKASPQLRSRLQGSSQGLVNEVGGAGQSRLKRQEFSERFMRGIQWADGKAILSIFHAAELKVASEQPGMTSEQAQEEAARIAERVVNRTQPVWDPLRASAIALEGRSNPLAKAITMFMSQRNQNMNMIARAVMRAQRGEDFWEQLVNIAMVLLGQGLGILAVQELWDFTLNGFQFEEDNQAARIATDFVTVVGGNVYFGSFITSTVNRIMFPDIFQFDPELAPITGLMNDVGEGMIQTRRHLDPSDRRFWLGITKTGTAGLSLVGSPFAAPTRMARRAFLTQSQDRKKKRIEDKKLTATKPAL